MRLSNRNKKPVYNFIYTFVGIVFVLGIIAFLLEINKFDIFGKFAWVLLAFPLLLFLFLYIAGRPIFDYDSDGETLNLRNNHILYLLSKKNAKDEFPKYKLLKFNIINWIIFKRLYVYISSKKSNILILKYDISYLNRKQIKDLKFSLNKVAKNNKETRKETANTTVNN